LRNLPEADDTRERPGRVAENVIEKRIRGCFVAVLHDKTEPVGIMVDVVNRQALPRNVQKAPWLLLPRCSPVFKGVAKVTVRQALSVLAADRLIEWVQGKVDTKMIIPVLQRVAKRSLAKMTQSFRIQSADLRTARLLDVPLNAPIGEVRRVITNHDNEVLYVGVGRYRGTASRTSRALRPWANSPSG
jgi:hypothetical protein